MRAVLGIILGAVTTGCLPEAASAPEVVTATFLSKEVASPALDYRGGMAAINSPFTLNRGETFAYETVTLGDDCRRKGLNRSSFRRDGDTLNVTVNPVDTVYTFEEGLSVCGALRQFKRPSGNMTVTEDVLAIKVRLVGVRAADGSPMEITRIVEIK